MKNTPQDSFSKTRRVASNTIVLFTRMLILMIANLWAVRLVLKGLGQQDYGIFNTVAAVVTTASFVSGVLALAIQRFYSYASGEGNDRKLNQIYSASVTIVTICTLGILVLFETIGLWFVNTQLTIPAERMVATMWAYQFSLLSFVCAFMQIPFLAAVFSHEDMGIYTIVSTLECLGKMAIAALISYVALDGLTFYGGGLFIIAFLVMSSYIMIAHKRYEECKLTKVEDKSLYKQLLNFSGWTTFGSLANTAMIQGGVILLNIFFGPLVNAAFGIAMQINNGLNTLSNSMVLPFRPAMIKAYAAKNYAYVNQLFTANNKSMFYLFLAVCLPIVMEMKTILSLWLGTDNAEYVLFARLMVIYTLIITMHNPITIIMHATGKIKQYHLPTETMTLMSFPLTWLLFILGMPSFSIFISIIMCCIVSHIIRLICLRRYYEEFSISGYMLSFALPAVLVALVSSVSTYMIHNAIGGDVVRLIIMIIAVPAIVLLLAYLIGINKNERTMLHSFITSTILHSK